MDTFAMKNRGFTVIELLVAIMIIGIAGMLIAGGVAGITAGSVSEISYGINGTTETRCISGVKFVVGSNGHPTQVMSTDGKGVAC